MGETNVLFEAVTGDFELEGGVIVVVSVETVIVVLIVMVEVEL